MSRGDCTNNYAGHGPTKTPRTKPQHAVLSEWRKTAQLHGETEEVLGWYPFPAPAGEGYNEGPVLCPAHLRSQYLGHTLNGNATGAA